MAAFDDNDDEVDLGISLETVATVVDLARAVDGGEEAGRDEFEEEESAEGLTEEEIEDSSEDALREYLGELNEDEQVTLIALAWIGRGDYGPEEWEEARTLAAERNTGSNPVTYLMNMDTLGDLLTEGLAAFGLSLEEIER